MRIYSFCVIGGDSAILWAYEKSDTDYKDDITDAATNDLLALPVGDDYVGAPFAVCYTRLRAR